MVKVAQPGVGRGVQIAHFVNHPFVLAYHGDELPFNVFHRSLLVLLVVAFINVSQPKAKNHGTAVAKLEKALVKHSSFSLF